MEINTCYSGPGQNEKTPVQCSIAANKTNQVLGMIRMNIRITRITRIHP